MTKHRIPAAIGLALACTAVATTPVEAKPHVKHAVFQLSVKGSEATTWHFERAPDPQLCGAAQHSDGDQMIRFHNDGAEQVTVTQAPGERPEIKLDSMLTANVERSAEFQMDTPIFPGRGPCTGIVHTPPFQQPGCGNRSGAISLQLGYTAESVGDPAASEDDPAPLVPDRNHLRLRGINGSFDGESLLIAYGQCPLFAAPDRPEARGDLLEVVEPVREAGLFKKSRKTIKAHAGRVEDFKLGPASGRTAIAYNVTLKRVG
jgi:hypothetical protein